MAVMLFISGFFAGMYAAAILTVGNMRSEARRKRERERLNEEIRREIEMEESSKNSPRESWFFQRIRLFVFKRLNFVLVYSLFSFGFWYSEDDN